MGAETEENVNIGFHLRELKGRPLSQRGAGRLEGNKVKGVGPGETKQGKPENRGRRRNRKKSKEWGTFPIPVRVPLNKSGVQEHCGRTKGQKTEQTPHPGPTRSSVRHYNSEMSTLNKEGLGPRPGSGDKQD